MIIAVVSPNYLVDPVDFPTPHYRTTTLSKQLLPAYPIELSRLRWPLSLGVVKWKNLHVVKIKLLNDISQKWIAFTSIAWILSLNSCVLLGCHASTNGLASTRWTRRRTKWLSSRLLSLSLARRIKLQRVTRRSFSWEFEWRRLKNTGLFLIKCN